MRVRIKILLPMLALLLLLPLASFADEEILIASVDATSWIVGKDPDAYAPHRMIDDDETTTFQFSTKTTPLGNEYLTFYLGSPSSVSTLWIKNGFWRVTSGNDQYIRNSRVKTMIVDFQYNYSDIYTDAITITLPDDKARSSWTIISLGTHNQVTAVRFLIQDIYVGSKYKTDVCISEVRFYSESSAQYNNLYGLAMQKLATRSGPGTQYASKGTYIVAGQFIKILSRAWDDRNNIWWVKCEIPYKGETRVLWTGYKRFDSSTIPLNTIPVEDETYTTSSTSQQSKLNTTSSSNNTWQDAYFQFVFTGRYKQYIRNDNSEYPEFSQMLMERDADSDFISLYDLNADGIPELLIQCVYVIEQIDVFTFSTGNIIWLGTVGGDNFFQDVFYFPGSEYGGLFATLGGPAMEIRRCTLNNNRFTCENIASTLVNEDGDSTIGIQMDINDNTLYSILYNTFVYNQDSYISLRWNRITEISDSNAWQAFIRTMNE